jgi:myo-inositol-1(or 4)-monophosphatase
MSGKDTCLPKRTPKPESRAVPDPKDIDAFLSELMPRLSAEARAGFGNPAGVHFKSRGQIVTQTDGDIEKAASAAIRAAWPNHRILGEESGWKDGTDDTTWYIDPIDGTMNFAHGIPFFSVSIGVWQAGKMVVGHVSDPLRDEHFHASLGTGAWMGAEPIHVSEVRELDRANLSLQSTSGSTFVREPGVMLEIHRRFEKVRKLGSIALEMAYVASGRLDFMLAGDVRPQPWWDIAGGWPLIEGAGGALEDLKGGPMTDQTTHFMAGHEELLMQFRKWYGETGR